MLDPLSDPEKYERMCNGKDRYTSESAAIAAMRALRKERVLKRTDNMRAYECDFGPDRHYHFGH